MNIKKNDKVKILAGKDKNKLGKVLQTMPSRGRLSIEGLNILVKHLRPSKQGEKGQRVEFPAFISISNVALICPECGKQTRVGYKFKEIDGKKKKFRACKKCQAFIS